MELMPHVIYVDEFLVVIDKPAGLVVNNAESVKGPTVQDWFRESSSLAFLDDDDTDFSTRGGIVHRLDKETSGILILAKTRESFVDMLRQFKNRVVEKKYLALVHGKVFSREGIINAPISRNPFNRGRFGVFPGGRESETHYRVINIFEKRSGVVSKDNIYSFLEVMPHTGRTHQIRVHLRHLGFPIVSDLLYAGRKTVALDLKWCPRMFLHASSIDFIHPINKEKMHFESKLPEDLDRALSGLLEKKDK